MQDGVEFRRIIFLPNFLEFQQFRDFSSQTRSRKQGFHEAINLYKEDRRVLSNYERFVYSFHKWDMASRIQRSR